MAEASLVKATAMQDQFALSLFTMPSHKGLTDQAQKYIELRHIEEMERLERRTQAERRAAELEKLEHERLLKERNSEAPNCRRPRGATPARVLPSVVSGLRTTAPPSTIPNPAVMMMIVGMMRHRLSQTLLRRGRIYRFIHTSQIVNECGLGMLALIQ